MIQVCGNCFLLHGKDSTYILKTDEQGRMYHLYYGQKLSAKEYPLHQNKKRGWSAQDINKPDAGALPVNDVGWSPKDDRGISLDEAPQEYPAYGRFDLRSPAYQVELPDGNRITDARYEHYEILDGKPPLEGLPAVYDADGNAQTLLLHLKDPVAGLGITLSYTVFDDLDVVCRSARLENLGDSPLILHSAFSANVDFLGSELDAICLAGAWGRERHVIRRPVQQGILELSNARGGSGHQMNPFVILCERSVSERSGEAYGFSLVYSGNHCTRIEQDQYGVVRVQMGIHPGTFQWELAPKSSFTTPECVLAYSSAGLGTLSRTYHDLYRTRLVRGYWKDRDRPVLLNNWEATYFAFDEEKILQIARRAKEAGIELLVLDDGWFGKRNNDHCSLGDWTVNLEKLPHGITGLAERVNELGLQFGLWFEPEAISPDSDLYRAHPDWAVRVPGREPAVTRWQYVLDLTRPEIRSYIVEAICSILRCGKISYVKWDMNRHITDLPNMTFSHRYILGLYQVLEAITQRFPQVLFESCSGGGGRFDPGMLYYMPQVWTSDDSDALERMKIQYGTSFCYPLSTMAAHVSAVPNHQTDRSTPLGTRGDVAKFGQFGYELDLTALPEESFLELCGQVRQWKAIRTLIRTGSFYRLVSPFETDRCAWQVVSPDRRECCFLYGAALSQPNPRQTIVRLQGLDSAAVYQNCETGCSYGGDELMYYGLSLALPAKDFCTVFLHLKAVEPS